MGVPHPLQKEKAQLAQLFSTQLFLLKERTGVYLLRSSSFLDCVKSDMFKVRISFPSLGKRGCILAITCHWPSP